MEPLFDFDTFEEESTADTSLMLHINAKAEQDFLQKIGGMNARKSDIAAMVDQYNGTNVKTLCFAGSNPEALEIWADRCRKLGLTSLQVVSLSDDTNKICESGTDGYLLDARKIDNFGIVSDIAKTTDTMLYLLLPQDAKTAVLQEIPAETVQGIVLCSIGNKACHILPDSEWMSKQKDFSIFAGVGELLCEANGKTWFPTPEIMNGLAVEVLSNGYCGLFLDGFCADILNPDTQLYDIYENCGCLQECVEARRRHLLLVNEDKAVLPGATYCFSADITPVFKGAPVCFVLAADGAVAENDIQVYCGEKQAQYTGAPVVLARNENGKLRENSCIAGVNTCLEYYLGNDFENDKIEIIVHNKSKKTLVLRWAELSVNI